MIGEEAGEEPGLRAPLSLPLGEVLGLQLARLGALGMLSRSPSHADHRPLSDRDQVRRDPASNTSARPSPRAAEGKEDRRWGGGRGAGRDEGRGGARVWAGLCSGGGARVWTGLFKVACGRGDVRGGARMWAWLFLDGRGGLACRRGGARVWAGRIWSAGGPIRG